MRQNSSSEFYNLTIEDVFSCAEKEGFHLTGEYFQLNSYENRVFDLFLEPERNAPKYNDHLIVKVYRPLRWDKDALLEEHGFLSELDDDGLSVIRPINLSSGSTLTSHKNMMFSFFPKARGRLPQELFETDFRRLGQKLARLHNIGAQKGTDHRPYFDVDSQGWDSLNILETWVAPEVWDRYRTAAYEICEFLEDKLNPDNFVRIHGDFHKGNILQSDPAQGEKDDFLVDFDDFGMGPEVQDFWMLLSGDTDESSSELDALIDGYTQLRSFDESQLSYIPGLRGLRIIKYAAWIARRWDDPSFPKLFPDFRSYVYWAEEVEALEKIAWSLDQA